MIHGPGKQLRSDQIESEGQQPALRMLRVNCHAVTHTEYCDLTGQAEVIWKGIYEEHCWQRIKGQAIQMSFGRFHCLNFPPMLFSSPTQTRYCWANLIIHGPWTEGYELELVNECIFVFFLFRNDKIKNILLLLNLNNLFCLLHKI